MMQQQKHQEIHPVSVGINVIQALQVVAIDAPATMGSRMEGSEGEQERTWIRERLAKKRSLEERELLLRQSSSSQDRPPRSQPQPVEPAKCFTSQRDPISSLGVLQLRRLLRRLGLPTFGLRPELARRLEEARASGVVARFTEEQRRTGQPLPSSPSRVRMRQAKALLSIVETLISDSSTSTSISISSSDDNTEKIEAGGPVSEGTRKTEVGPITPAATPSRSTAPAKSNASVASPSAPSSAASPAAASAPSSPLPSKRPATTPTTIVSKTTTVLVAGSVTAAASSARPPSPPRVIDRRPKIHDTQAAAIVSAASVSSPAISMSKGVLENKATATATAATVTATATSSRACTAATVGASVASPAPLRPTVVSPETEPASPPKARMSPKTAALARMFSGGKGSGGGVGYAVGKVRPGAGIQPSTPPPGPQLIKTTSAPTTPSTSTDPPSPLLKKSATTTTASSNYSSPTTTIFRATAAPVLKKYYASAASPATAPPTPVLVKASTTPDAGMSPKSPGRVASIVKMWQHGGAAAASLASPSPSAPSATTTSRLASKQNIPPHTHTKTIVCTSSSHTCATTTTAISSLGVVPKASPRTTEQAPPTPRTSKAVGAALPPVTTMRTMTIGSLHKDAAIGSIPASPCPAGSMPLPQTATNSSGAAAGTTSVIKAAASAAASPASPTPAAMATSTSPASPPTSTLPEPSKADRTPALNTATTTLLARPSPPALPLPARPAAALATKAVKTTMRFAEKASPPPSPSSSVSSSSSSSSGQNPLLPNRPTGVAPPRGGSPGASPTSSRGESPASSPQAPPKVLAVGTAKEVVAPAPAKPAMGTTEGVPRTAAEVVMITTATATATARTGAATPTPTPNPKNPKTTKGGVGMSRSGVIRAVSPSKLPSPDDYSDRDSFDSASGGGGGGGGGGGYGGGGGGGASPTMSMSPFKAAAGTPLRGGSPLKSAAINALKPIGSSPLKTTSPVKPPVVGGGGGGAGVVFGGVEGGGVGKKPFKAKDIKVFYYDDDEDGDGDGDGDRNGGGGGDASDNSEGGDKYLMSDGSGSDEEDDDPALRKLESASTPEWATDEGMVEVLERQYGGKKPVNPNKIFVDFYTCSLETIFDTKKKKWDRKSTGDWMSDRLTIAEKLAYDRAMGYVTINGNSNSNSNSNSSINSNINRDTSRRDSRRGSKKSPSSRSTDTCNTQLYE